jgi:hypothetical protein
MHFFRPNYLRSESIKDDNFDIDNENRKSPSADTSNEVRILT